MTTDPLSLQMQMAIHLSLNRFSNLNNSPYLVEEIQRLFVNSVLYQRSLTNPLTNNLYPYVLNNPVNGSDPFGLWFEDVAGAITSAAGAIGTGAFGLAGVAAGSITIATAPLSDFFFPKQTGGGAERRWLLERELKEFRETMEQAEKDIERIEALYAHMFEILGIEDQCG